MTNFNYIELFTALLHATETEKIKWNPEEVNPNQFYYFASRHRKILLDKFTAITDTEQLACYDITFFNEDGSIIDEVVLSGSSQEKEEFTLLEKLYGLVSDKYSGTRKDPATEILAELTASIQTIAAS